MGMENGSAPLREQDSLGGDTPPAQTEIEDGYRVMDLRGRPVDFTKTGAWKSAPHVYAMNFADFQASIMVIINCVPYLVDRTHMRITDAATASNVLSGTGYILTVLGGFVADSYLGAYWTITAGAAIFATGLGLLTFTVSYSGLQPPECTPSATVECSPAGAKFMAPVYLAFYIIAVGIGAMRANIASFGADQFDDNSKLEKKQSIHYYVWFYFTTNMGFLLTFVFGVYLVENVSFGWGYGFSLMVFSLCACYFLLGTPKYRHKAPAGSFLTRVAQVVVAAFRNLKVDAPDDPSLLFDSYLPGSRKLAHTDKLRFLDKAAVVQKGAADTKDRWRVCGVTQVEETKRILQMLPIWATTCCVSLVFSQLVTYTVTQGATLDRKWGEHFEVPAASLSAIFVLISLCTVPLYDSLFVPLVRKFTKHPYGLSCLQRLGVSIVCAILLMCVAALVERKRVTVVRDLGFEDLPLGSYDLPMSMWWLLPQFILAAQVEMFYYLSSYQFFYYEASDQTRSIASSFTYSASAMGYYLSSVINDLVNSATKNGQGGGWLTDQLNHGGLAKFYWLLAILLGVDFVFFLIAANWYQYKFDWFHQNTPSND
ncbi:protein MpNPF5 [Marchantia polymorpha subsp. ruderalis]|uniref:Uncharacterized protein n=4 Tax=Marchantia polymorpha TaxID=3197 RepID=A0AAF6AX14_MARPO|nr:hypothetical protein MARPO_0022s0185 [Marchantia polymorpha]BBN04298.1 hypothetical protein Mp_3g03470 [Marchantia polymorpha subsp. ruderalis]|eukprot:PTQ44102.1 hypothetical protein MARPO_0022s0185 [Marchantia polymorpha]